MNRLKETSKDGKLVLRKKCHKKKITRFTHCMQLMRSPNFLNFIAWVVGVLLFWYIRLIRPARRQSHSSVPGVVLSSLLFTKLCSYIDRHIVTYNFSPNFILKIFINVSRTGIAKLDMSQLNVVLINFYGAVVFDMIVCSRHSHKSKHSACMIVFIFTSYFHE